MATALSVAATSAASFSIVAISAAIYAAAVAASLLRDGESQRQRSKPRVPLETWTVCITAGPEVLQPSDGVIHGPIRGKNQRHHMRLL